MSDINDEKEHMLRWASEAVYAAGSDTTVSAILVFVLAMARNPEAQAKAHAELDKWIGVAEWKLPSPEDRPELSYIDKLLWEVLRWFPVVPLGTLHCKLNFLPLPVRTIPPQVCLIVSSRMICTRVTRSRQVQLSLLISGEGQEIIRPSRLIRSSRLFCRNILHDENMYPDPWIFNPDRFDNTLDIDNTVNMDPRKIMFGFGRR